MAERIAWLIATWFGCGLSPVAPGTVGSAAAVAVAMLLGWGSGELFWGAVALVGPAVWAAGTTARSAGSHDPGIVVVDEVVGQWIALLGATHLSWLSIAAGFGLFRLFDIWKPFPLRRLEALPGGFGIVADDMGAGILAAVVLYAAGWFNFY